MKVQLAGRPRISAFDLEPGQTFINEGKVFVAVVPCRIENAGQAGRVNAIKLETGSFFHFGPEIEVELVHGTFVEDDITSEVNL